MNMTVVKYLENFNSSPCMLKQDAVAIPIFTAIVAAMVATDSANTQSENVEKNIDAQKEINTQNIGMQKETNQQQLDMFHEQQDFIKKMWDLNNMYNSPSAKVGRLREANLNPALAFGDVQDASAVSAPAAPSLVAPRAEYHDQDIHAGQFDITPAQNAFMQAKLMNSQAKNLDSQTNHFDIQNMYDMKTIEQRIKQLDYLIESDKAHSDIWRADRDYLLAINEWRKEYYFGTLQLQDQEIEQAKLQNANVNLNNQILDIEKSWLPHLKQDEHNQYIQTLKESRARISLILAQKDKTLQEKETEIQRTLSGVLDNGLKGFDVKIKNETYQDLIDIVGEQLAGLEDENLIRGIRLGMDSRGNAWQNFTFEPGQDIGYEVWKRTQRRQKNRKK